MIVVHFYVWIQGKQHTVKREFRSMTMAQSFVKLLETPWKITKDGNWVEGEKTLIF